MFIFLITTKKSTWRHTELTPYRCRRLRNPLWWAKLLRTLLISECFLLARDSSWRWSWTKHWNSALQASMFDRFSHPHAIKPSKSYPKRKMGERSSPPRIVSGQKQLTPRPSSDLAATVDKMVVQNSSRKRRALVRNFFQRGARHFLRGCRKSSLHQEMLLFDRGKCRMVREHVALPSLDKRQWPTGFNLLKQSIVEMWHLAICVVAVIAPWKLLCHKIVVVSNRGAPLNTKFENEDATRILQVNS